MEFSFNTFIDYSPDEEGWCNLTEHLVGIAIAVHVLRSVQVMACSSDSSAGHGLQQ